MHEGKSEYPAMTNERHEKALEAAAAAFAFASFDEADVAIVIKTYLQAMEVVIVPKEATVEMQRAGFGSRWRLDTKLGIQAATELYADMISKAPNHFTNGE